jgi:signal peptidase I
MGSLLENICDKGGALKLKVRGMSMSPFICDGDVVMINALKESPIKVGDVVACTHPDTGKLMIHRVVQINGKQYLLKGDHLYDNDGWFEKKDIHGHIKNEIMVKKIHGCCYKLIRNWFRILGGFKTTVAFASRLKIQTLVCRMANKLMNENAY